MARLLTLAPLGLLFLSGMVKQTDARVNPYNYHSLKVEGRGNVDIATDSLKILMTISNQSEDCYNKTLDTCDASAVQKKTNSMTQKLVSTMAETDGVVGISAGQISLQPQYQYNDTVETDVFNGFLSTIELAAIVKGKIAGKFLNDCVKMGVTSINSIEYFISDQVMKESQQKALKLASEDAMAQAQAVLDVLGYNVTQVKQVKVPNLSNPIKNNGPADLDNKNPDLTSVSAIRTVGYAVSLRLKYN